jgi:hypothetical protein
MKLEFRFETPHTDWSVLLVFKQFYDYFVESYKDIEIEYVNSSTFLDRNPSGLYSPHIMSIKNLDNQKYIIVSYWDRAVELTWDGNGWDNNNCVELITSSGVHNQDLKTTPFSYLTYSRTFEGLSQNNKIDFYFKKDNDLFFRGFLYSHRKIMSDHNPNSFIKNKIGTHEFFNEINESKVVLSLNGAGEICNRDIEILSTGSVLIRPKLTQKFHNELIPDVHYVSVDNVDDPVNQFELIKNKFESIKNNHDYLNKISKNGLIWFQENGTINANVEILKTLININKLL